MEPRWLGVARALIGLREIKGPQHNPTIMGWIRKLGSRLGITVTDDETPWCGTFVAHVMSECGIELPKIPVRATSWLGWGRTLVGPRLGCVLVFTRSGGGHVGFYVGEDNTAYHVLGGNQSDSVSITRIAKSRLTGMRWPHGEPLPPITRVFLNSGGAISNNEA